MTREEALENKKIVQQTSVSTWILHNFIGTLCLATGVGKTKIGLDCLTFLREESNPKVLIAVPTEGMRDYDWPDEFVKWNVSQDNVKIVCYASLHKENFADYDYIIFDENHNLTVPMLHLLKTTMTLKPLKVLGLTATPSEVASYPEEMERVNLLTSVVPAIYTVTTDQAVELGLIQDFKVHVLKFFLDDTKKVIKAGSEKKPFYNTEKAQYKYLTKQLKIAMAKAAEEPDDKEDGMKYIAMSKRTQFLYNLPSKLKLAQWCMDRLIKPDKRTLVMAGSIEQANKLCGVERVYHSESDKKALDRFQNLEDNLLGAVRALDKPLSSINVSN